MRKIGLKLWSCNTDNYLNIAQSLYKDGFFDYIELYIVPGNQNRLKNWLNLNIPFDIHAPHFAHNMNLSKKEYLESNLEYYKEVKLYADALESDVIVFHGGTDGYLDETIRQLNLINDVRTLIENKPYKVMPFINGKHYVGCTPDEIKNILSGVNCGFCFDVCHALCVERSLGLPTYTLCESFVDLKPKRIHLSDHNILEELDYHLNYGKGSIDFERILKIIPADVAITVETPKSSKTDLEDFKQDVCYLKEKINRIDL